MLLDYEDFLRQRALRQWRKYDPEARAVRVIGTVCAGTRRQPTNPTDRTDREQYAAWLDHADPAVVANAIICLIHQANYLLDQQIRSLEKDFISEGGYSEKLAAARLAHRQAETASPVASAGAACPACRQPMVLRTARQGARAGSQFWGCFAYPGCKAPQPL